MDIALVLDTLRPGAKWRRADTYADLVATWDDTEQTLPTEQEIISAWDTIQALQGNAVIYAELAGLDVDIPRGLEDTWTALAFDTTTLPEIQQTRLTRKIALRLQIIK